MTDRTPFVRGMTTRAPDELALRPDDDGIDACIGMSITPEGEPVPHVHLVFRDPLAGPINIALDVRLGHAERIHGQLQRLLAAVYQPDEHPEDAAQMETLLHDLIQRAKGRNQ
ncbi:hypothetical protein [[Mycobacterium] burgundiense]|uniref:Uncharacterized protein n=1 Tax=[Mycobacterium] burgundiense TaxID=3064286 RepID=A0ABM9LW61_9MYCO|nr:hypothetical protein [Mycolicibacterium sp. MU0053]CAJ1505684.1 hypothetical protein MU0053_003001 [Mycolicibacterium sp. MU0053]